MYIGNDTHLKAPPASSATDEDATPERLELPTADLEKHLRGVGTTAHIGKDGETLGEILGELQGGGLLLGSPNQKSGVHATIQAEFLEPMKDIDSRKQLACVWISCKHINLRGSATEAQ